MNENTEDLQQGATHCLYSRKGDWIRPCRVSQGGNKAFGVVDSLTDRKAVTDCFHPSIHPICLLLVQFGVTVNSVITLQLQLSCCLCYKGFFSYLHDGLIERKKEKMSNMPFSFCPPTLESANISSHGGK